MSNLGKFVESKSRLLGTHYCQRTQTSVAEIEYSLCKKHDINLLRHDYNEPQCGKDQADRDSAVAKKF